MEENDEGAIKAGAPRRAMLRGAGLPKQTHPSATPSYLLTTAMLSFRPKSRRQLQIARAFGRSVRLIRWASQLKRKEAARRSKLDQQVWTAVERGYVPLDEIPDLLPQLAKGLGYKAKDIRVVMQRATEHAR